MTLFRPLFRFLVHPWLIAAFNLFIAVILLLSFRHMYDHGMRPVEATDDIIEGLGVILIAWGVAMEERHKLREVFGLIGNDEDREQAIDESCHRYGVGQLLFGLFAEIGVELVKIPDELFNTEGIESFVLGISALLLAAGLVLLVRQSWTLVMARETVAEHV